MLDQIQMLDGTAKHDLLRTVREDLWRETEARVEFNDLVDQFTLAQARAFHESKNGGHGS